MLPEALKKILQFFTKFSEIGPRQGLRFVFWLIRQEKEQLKNLEENLKTLREKIKFCSNCFFPTEDEYCKICQDPHRDRTLLMIVARETDYLSMEQTKIFKGIYYILGGLITPFSDNSLIEKRLEILQEKLKNNNIKEIIIGLPHSPEAQVTFQEIVKITKKFKIPISQLAQGIPYGGEVEFLDPETLKNAYQRRERIKE